ncbi:MAG: hypothetical protein RLZZ480_512 [Candidatus Parcubacteria bacterium]|jgi:hypothetical protein
MTTVLTLIAILQSFSISLGVGSSTIAITSFFVAIADGSMSPDERRMMGVVYVVLRVAMVLILLTTATLLIAKYGFGGLTGMSTFHLGQSLAILVLFVNAVLMTLHVIPSNFGPAIQAGNWYTLGTLSALLPLGITHFTLTQFALAYVAWLVLAISIVNAIMAIQMARRNKFIK